MGNGASLKRQLSDSEAVLWKYNTLPTEASYDVQKSSPQLLSKLGGVIDTAHHTLTSPVYLLSLCVINFLGTCVVVNILWTSSNRKKIHAVLPLGVITFS